MSRQPEEPDRGWVGVVLMSIAIVGLIVAAKMGWLSR